MLVLAEVMLERKFISAVQDVGNVTAGVGNTDVMLPGPSTIVGLLGHVKDGKWIRLRDERRRRSAPLIELPLPWLQCRPYERQCCHCT